VSPKKGEAYELLHPKDGRTMMVLCVVEERGEITDALILYADNSMQSQWPYTPGTVEGFSTDWLEDEFECMA
jgi:hypothetical protein